MGKNPGFVVTLALALLGGTMILAGFAVQRVESERPLEQAILLSLVATFPNLEQESQGIYLQQGSGIACDPENHRIYVVDARGNCIHIFNPEFEFVKSVGQKGQGPGEMNNPKCVALANALNIMAVRDEGNRRIDLFRLDGEFVKSFRYLKSVESMGMMPSGHILLSSRSPELSESLLDVYDQEGKITRSFGNRIDFGDNTRSLNGASMSVGENGNVGLAFHLINRIVIYDSQGRELVNRSLPFQDLDDNESFNKKSKYDQASGSQKFKAIFAGVFTAPDAIYVSRHYPRLEIYKIDFHGRLLAVYYYKGPSDYIGGDLCVDEKSGRIYVIQNYPESNVQVFEIPAGAGRQGEWE